MCKYDVEKKKWNKKSASRLIEERDLTITSNYKGTFSKENVLRPVYEYFDITNKNIHLLDYGCGTGWTTFLFSQKVNKVSAFDISHTRIKVLRRIIEYNAISNILPCVANGEQLPYRKEQFDYVFGNAILHHLDLEPALSEITKVLKQNGKAAFCEPFGHNPIINLYRYVKHNFIETYKGTDKPLRYDNLPLFHKYFKEVRFIESSFLSRKAPLMRSFEKKLLKIKLFRKYASYVTILLRK
jgi:ubiquinone/menaquinone biosynthesis C-methylase UbiE